MVFSFFQLVVNEEPDLSPLSPDHGIAVDLVIPDCIALRRLNKRAINRLFPIGYACRGPGFFFKGDHPRVHRRQAASRSTIASYMSTPKTEYDVTKR